jgi:hypothetical protein
MIPEMEKVGPRRMRISIAGGSIDDNTRPDGWSSAG